MAEESVNSKKILRQSKWKINYKQSKIKKSLGKLEVGFTSFDFNRNYKKIFKIKKNKNFSNKIRKITTHLERSREISYINVANNSNSFKIEKCIKKLKYGYFFIINTKYGEYNVRLLCIHISE